MKVKTAYIMSRFPKLTETFILYEILALEQQGMQVDLYPLLRARNSAVQTEGGGLLKKVAERFSRQEGELVMHPEARPLVERAHYQPFFSWQILGAQFQYIFKKPGAYLSALLTILRANWGSPNFFFGVLSIFPKTVYFASLMQSTGVDHVHAHFANHPAAAAWIVHRLTGIPYSFTAHGADLQVDQHMLVEKVKEAAFTVTISNYNQDLIVQKCGEEYRDKIIVIRCGVDTQQFQPKAIEKNGQLFTILCIGTFYEVKGHTYLIEACRLLQERGIDFVCRLVGEGPDRSALEKQVNQAGLSEKVKFLGTKTRPQILELLQNADCLAVPSIPTPSGRREGLPVVLIEAMGTGLPVVASGISGIPELVEDGKSGLLVPPRSPQFLAEALECLQADPVLRKHLGMAGRQKVLREFDLNTNVALLAQHFRGEI